ncbi:MAG: hypothetical protein EPN39_09500 [Chitinophagaceae bacterium]|nr:MAG: hypothetical protein EPN39_09500 [Chitinophagaceae bacterium]
MHIYFKNIILLLFIIAFSGCIRKEKDYEYYNVNNYYPKDSSYNMKRRIIQRIYLNKYDSSWILVKRYWNNGTLASSTYLHNFQKEGPFLINYPDETKIWGKGNYKSNAYNGEIDIYHENGRIYKIMYFKVGKAIGTWKAFDSTGHLIDSTVHQ